MSFFFFFTLLLCLLVAMYILIMPFVKKKNGHSIADKIYAKEFTLSVEVILYLSLGVILTIGSYRWILPYVKDEFSISYSGYAMILIVILLFSEIWALFIQIPAIHDYNKIAPEICDKVRVSIGLVLLIILCSLVFVYQNESSQNGTLHVWLTGQVYKVCGYKNDNYKERLEVLDKIIDREGMKDIHYAERGRLYLEIAEIKSGRKDDNALDFNKDIYPGKSGEECYTNAINDYNNAIELNSQVADYYFRRGIARLHNYDTSYEEAKDDIENSIVLDSTKPEYFLYSAKAWKALADDAEINREDLLSTAIDRIERSIQLYENNGIGKSNQYNDVQKSDDTFADYYNTAGLIYQLSYNVENENNMEELNMLDKAIEAFVKATELNNNKASYYKDLGIAYYTKADENNYDLALIAFDNALSIDKRNSDYSGESYDLAWKGLISELLKNDKMAVSYYDQALRLRPDYVYVYSQLGNLYLRHEQNDDEIALYGKAIKGCSDLDKAVFYYRRGMALIRIENYDKAIEDIKAAIDRDVSYARDGYWNIGNAYYIKHDYKLAYDNYELALNYGYDEIAAKRWMDYCQNIAETNN